VGLIGPGGIAQPFAAVFPATRAKEAVARAARGEKVLLAFGNEA
jgi:hypothetical protein